MAVFKIIPDHTVQAELCCFMMKYKLMPAPIE